MPARTKHKLHLLLAADLKKAGSDGLSKVLNDSARKVFVARRDHVLFEFGYTQPDPSFWTGLKYYGSGARTKFRIRRSAVEV